MTNQKPTNQTPMKIANIKGYEGLYVITNCGAIFSIKYGKLRRPISNYYGYLRVDLWKNNKQKKFYIHRLVAIHFIHNPENKSEVNHKDFHSYNNHEDNLEWSTRQENMSHKNNTEPEDQEEREPLPF